jgi:hypothetical protein
MSRRVLWHRRAIADLLNVADWQTAARIDAEVLYFAESGRGTVRRVRSEDGPDELRLGAARFEREVHAAQDFLGTP